MNTQRELILTQQVDGGILTLAHVADNTFRLSISKGVFVNGKTGYTEAGPINQAVIDGSSVLITKAELKRLGTYMLYLNGKDAAYRIFGSPWYDWKGRPVIFSDADDVYYYFRRPDCGIRKDYDINGKMYGTTFHRPVGEKLSMMRETESKYE